MKMSQEVQRYGLDSLLLKGTVESIVPVMQPLGGSMDPTDHRRVRYFQVGLRDGSELLARHVVMATGPTRAQMANVPSWVSAIGENYPEGALQHTVRLMHHLPLSQTSQTQGQQVVCTEGQRVMVVGGGLTSAHVVSIALQQGASHVTWVMRKYLQLKQFDVGDVESLVGRYSHVEHGIQMDGRPFLLQFYSEKSLHRRLAMIRQARKGGAVTPEAYAHLQPFIQAGRVQIQTHCEVNEARWCYRSQAWSLALTTGGQWSGDVIWLATGCKLDVKQDPLLCDVFKEFPIQVLDGLPCVSESLQWTEGCPLYVMGQYSALQIGPHAVNLAGGQAASYRIAKHIQHQLQPQTEDQRHQSHKSKPEEFVNQMHSLMWL
uniref:L-ornithine N(5)-oxygenase n=1 Tax=Knipowitschia caucasica TaxID=637954 RepID=A0AAV2LUV3_KNICA